MIASCQVGSAPQEVKEGMGVATSRPVVRRRRLAMMLSMYRERAGMTLDDAAERIGCHRSKINRIENARLGISLGELRDLLTFYGVRDESEVEEMLALARRHREPGFVRRVGLTRPSYPDLVEYEETAEYIRSYQGFLVAGLLQTPDYARAILRATPSALDDQAVEAMVTARMERQEVLNRTEQPPRLCVIQQEASLRQRVGSAGVMGAQLDHLARMSERPGIDVQVIPDQAEAHAGLFGAFVLFAFANPAFSDVVCVEHRTGMLYMETPEETGEYTLIFDSLRSVALSPAASRDAILAAGREL
jgi:transcriptional regulator with XRE-family HTH domain